MEIPVEFIVLILSVVFALGWLIRGYFEAEAKRDEQMIDDALTRAYQAGWRAKQNRSDHI